MKNDKIVAKPIIHNKPPLRKVGRSMDIAKPRLVKPVVTEPPKIIKDEVITEAFKKLTDDQVKESIVLKRRSKIINIFSITVGIIFLLIISYFLYLNIPTLSVRVASAQTGINATYPEYHPNGYSVDGPVSYSDGQVTITFHADSGDSEFAIKQSRSSWDSSALKDKVKSDSNGDPITITTERGLTIYNYSGKASWVNGGILYTISGNAPLSSDQIRRIATSL